MTMSREEREALLAPLKPDLRRFGQLFVLVREQDVSGVSGTGLVADGVEFPDGTCVMRWRGQHRSTAVYANIAELTAIHGHQNKTKVRWL